MRVRVWAGLLLATTLAGAGFYLWWSAEPEEPVLAPAWTATVGVLGESVAFAEPYGVAAATDGTLYVTDGARGHRVMAITPHGFSAVIAGGREGFADGAGPAARFRTPSGVAIDRNGALYVADTGNNAIRRVTPDGQVTTVATGFNAPIGVAVAPDGRILVADTYNDRVAVIDATGNVTDLAVGVPLDTPAGVAAASDGTIYVADTGNAAVHAIAPDATVTTLSALDGGGMQRPMAIAIDADHRVYVSDESGRILEFPPRESGGAARVIAGARAGYRNGLGHEAQFRRPAGLVALAPGRLVIADAGNALLRTVVATTLAEAAPPPSPRLAPAFDVDAFTRVPLLWPLEPLGGPFEIAGTIGEARGADAGRFHAGIDVRADNGSPVLAVREGIVTSPIATGDFGTLNEWLRLGDVAYIHIRAGRTHRGVVVDPDRFVPSHDERGRIVRMRVKRGAHFATGDVIGSVNQFNHVHLNVGWGGEEYNPLLFRLVQFKDTIPPTIAPNGIQLLDAQGNPFATRTNGRLQISGEVQVVVDAWDQADGNRPSRRLGVYALGYQVLSADGGPLPGYEQPRETIRFDRLTPHPEATRLVYAPGSGIPFYGERRTRFLYIVTNMFHGGIAAPGMWDTARLAAGDYTLRVYAEDAAGNRTTRDLGVTVTPPSMTP